MSFLPDPIPKLAEALHNHLALGQEMLALVMQEHEALHAPGEFDPAGFRDRRKVLLPRLNVSLDHLSQYRQAWLNLSPDVRAGCPAIVNLIQTCQDVIMKTIVLDRENEQALLRRGLVPVRQLPAPQRQQPHFVAALYHRSAAR